MLRRNAAVALGCVGTSAAVPTLLEALRVDEQPLVRGHAAWAFGHMAKRGVADLPADELTQALAQERDVTVRDEIEDALRVSAGLR